MSRSLANAEGVVEKSTEEGSASSSGRVHGYMTESISTHHADLILLGCCFVSGLSDSGIFNTWSCFVSMQTGKWDLLLNPSGETLPAHQTFVGNTVFLGLGASGQPANKPYGWLRSLMAIVCFIVGSFLFGFAQRLWSRRRGLLFASFFVQGSCIATAAALAQARVVPEDADSFKVLIPVALLGFQAGGQVSASNFLGYQELPTTVLTILYSALATDPRVFVGLRQNAKRNRRLLAVILLLLGAIIGGWLTRNARGLPIVLWIAAALKFTMAGCWLIWKREESP